jgi:hypothetical protein
MEDEGTLGDHQSGVSATDGNWHHVAGKDGGGCSVHHSCQQHIAVVGIW